MNKILVTLLVGIGVGILMAPGKGSETLQKIRDSFDDLKDNLKDGIDGMMDAEKGMINKGKRKVDSALD